MSLIHETEQEKQMSEAFVNSAFLALSGGFQDAYTYFTREEVFSNAQTGNVVLMSQHFMCGEWMAGLRYLFPILSFAVGVWVAEQIQGRYRYARKLHWRQSILLLEIVILFVVGFIPTRLDMMATALVSFSCHVAVVRIADKDNIFLFLRCFFCLCFRLSCLWLTFCLRLWLYFCLWCFRLTFCLWRLCLFKVCPDCCNRFFIQAGITSFYFHTLGCQKALYIVI